MWLDKILNAASVTADSLCMTNYAVLGQERSHFVSVPNGSMIISLLMNITMNQLGGASVIVIFTTRRSHGYVNTTTWLGISQFFLFLAPNFNILTTENRSICNRDLN